MTQSTASYGLDKLRHAFSDPLFIREGRGVAMTDLGEQIIGECRAVLDRLDGLADLSSFDPGTAHRDFVIAAPGFEVHIILAPLRRLLAKEAPGIRLVIRSLDLSAVAQKLERDWDLALMGTPPAGNHLKCTRLFEDKFVTFYDPDIRSAPKDIDEFCAAPHAIATLGGDSSTAVDKALSKKSRSREVRLIVNNFESLPVMMEGSDLITTIAERMGTGLMRGFAHAPCPIELTPIPVQAVWHARRQTEPGHIWLRQKIREVVKSNA